MCDTISCIDRNHRTVVKPPSVVYFVLISTLIVDTDPIMLIYFTPLGGNVSDDYIWTSEQDT